jgi:large subunit ribosomal protein L1
MFPHVIKIAKFLGPKGLMPSPAKGTVSDDIKAMLSSVRALTKFEMDPKSRVLKLGKSYSIGYSFWIKKI